MPMITPALHKPTTGVRIPKRNVMSMVAVHFKSLQKIERLLEDVFPE
jgi:hypothetical protein